MEDDLYPKAVEMARFNGGVSTSMLQRKLLIGYNRAWRLVEKLSTDGLIGPRKSDTAMRDYIGA